MNPSPHVLTAANRLRSLVHSSPYDRERGNVYVSFESIVQDAIDAAMAQPTLKAWHASYSWRGGWGAFQEYEAVVIAETQSAALGWVLMTYPDTRGENWTFAPIGLDEAGVTMISQASS